MSSQTPSTFTPTSKYAANDQAQPAPATDPDLDPSWSTETQARKVAGATTCLHVILDDGHKPRDDGIEMGVAPLPGRDAAVLVRPDMMWDSPMQFTYAFIPDPKEQIKPQDDQRAKVREYVQEWALYANVSFKEVDDPAKALVRIAFGKTGSWSYVGRNIERCTDITKPTMNLGWIKPYKVDPAEAALERAVILHEWGHTLGLLHEHESPAHDNRMINKEAAYEYYGASPNFWSKEMVDQQVLAFYDLSAVSNFSRVDVHSIMHYPQTKEITGLSYDIPYQTELSDWDKAYIILNYPRASYPKGGWNIDRALKAAELPEDVCDAIRNAVAHETQPDGEIKAQKIRNILSDYTQKAFAGYLDPESGVLPTPVGSDSDILKVVPIAIADQQTGCGTIVASASQQDPALAQSGAEFAAMTRQALRPLAPNGQPLQIYWKAFGNDGVQGPSARQLDLIQKSLARWSGSANVQFIEAAEPSRQDDIDLLITFDPDLKSSKASISRSSAWTTDKKERTALRKKTHDVYGAVFPAWAQSPDASMDIIIRGCPADVSSRSKVEQAELTKVNLRSITHEVGHALGLDHEELGFYHALIQNPELQDPTGPAIVSTRYDFGSLMDAREQQVAFAATQKMVDAAGLGSIVIDDLDPRYRELAVAYDLSPYDRANIALLYPGPQLLKRAQVGSGTLLESYLASVRLDEGGPATRSILAKAKSGDWGDVREQYLKMLHEQAAKLLPTLKALVNKAKTSSPQHSLDPDGPLQGPQADPQHDSAPATRQPLPDFAEILYTKLSSVFKTSGDQYLALQLPARYLDKNTFTYKTDGIYSQFLKPTVVNEAEFRLTDQLYDVGKFVGGPNGKSLSTTYEAVINNLVPRSTNKDIAKEREKYRAFLLREGPDQAQYYVNDAIVKQSGTTPGASASSTSSTGLQIIGDSKDPIAAAAAAFGDDVLYQLSGTKGPAETQPSSSGSAPSGAARSLEQSLAASRAALPRKMTLIETSNYLYSEYANDKTRWELGRDDMVRKAIRDSKNDPEALNDVTRRLAHISQAVNSRLSMKYLDAVVRGYYHVVREMVGLMDIKSPAELLQDAKDSFRESALSSVFTASRVWPVLMGPQDWADSLDTSFTPRDLSESPDILQSRIASKGQQLETLQNQLALLSGAQEGDAATLADKLAKAEKAKLDAISALHAEYGAATVGAVQLAFKLYLAAQTGGVSLAAEEGIKTATTAFAAKAKAGQVRDVAPRTQAVLGVLDEKQLQDIAASSQRVDNKQTAVIEAIRSQVAVGAELASAKASDTITQQEILRNKAKALVKELEDLQSRFDTAIRASKARDAAKTTKLADDASLAPPLPTGRWQAISITSEVSESASHLSKQASSSSSDWKLSLWIASAQSSSSSASASENASSTDKSVKISLDFQATLVTVDRAGWFDPGFLANSSSFMKNDETFSWTLPRPSRVPEHPAGTPNPPAQPLTSEQMVTAIRGEDGHSLSEVFPSQPRFGAFPAGYIIVKDVIAKVNTTGSSQSTSSSNFQEKKASSGGFLCFSHSSGEENSGSQQDSTSEARADGFVVRIPGPQVLGYIQQLTPADDSTPWDPKESLLSNLNIPAALPHLVFDDGTQKPGPARGALPARAPEQPAGAAGATGDDGSDGKGTGKSAAPAAAQPAYGVWRQVRDGEA